MYPLKQKSEEALITRNGQSPLSTSTVSCNVWMCYMYVRLHYFCVYVYMKSTCMCMLKVSLSLNRSNQRTLQSAETAGRKYYGPSVFATRSFSHEKFNVCCSFQRSSVEQKRDSSQSTSMPSFFIPFCNRPVL